MGVLVSSSGWGWCEGALTVPHRHGMMEIRRETSTAPRHMKKFNDVTDLRIFAADHSDTFRLEPHHSASYLWKVWHPASFGSRMTYGFSTSDALLDWANQAL